MRVEKSTVAKVRKKGIRSIDSRTFVSGVTPFSSQAFILDQTTPRRLSGVGGGALRSSREDALHEVVNRLISSNEMCIIYYNIIFTVRIIIILMVNTVVIVSMVSQ